MLQEQLAQREQEQTEQESRVHQQEEGRTQAQAVLKQLMADMEALHSQYSADGDKQHRTELARSRVENDLKVLQDRHLEHMGGHVCRSGGRADHGGL